MQKVFLFIWVLLLPTLLYPQQKSLTLASCIQLALKNNPGLQMYRTQQESAGQKVKETRAELFPSLVFSANYRRQSVVPEINFSDQLAGLPFPIEMSPVQMGSETSYEGKVQVQQPIFTGFRLTNAKKAAQANAEAKTAELAVKTNEIIFQVETAFLNVLKAEQAQEIANTATEQVKTHLRDVQNMLNQGLVRQNELLQVQVKMSEAEMRIARAKNGVAMARALLENLINVSIDSTQLVAPLFELSELKTVEDSYERALKNRPELCMLDYNINSTEKLIKVAKGGYYPSLMAFGNYAYGKPGLDFIKDELMDYWIVGLGAQWTLFNWGKTSAQVQTARLQKRYLTEALEQSKKGIKLDVTKACLQIQNSLEQKRLAENLVNQAAENFRVQKAGFKQGVTKNSDFLDAQLDLTRAQLALSQAELDLQIAFANWKRAVGNYKYE